MNTKTKCSKTGIMMRLFRRDERGATAIEYTILAPIFLLLVFMTIEFSIYLYKRNHLKSVMYDASRLLQTGQIQNDPNMFQAFKNEICASSVIVFECNEVFFDVRSYNNFADVDFPAITYNPNGHPNNFVFLPGKPSQYSAVRVAGLFDFVTPFMRDIFLSDDKPVLVIGHAIARAEPYNCTQTWCQ
ncbi:MAG: TadE/TadG family type IV pilus assembly protein [Ahrensia sp.]|nr:TadE/TadG family type IV pilus assembly protein [Ahrensia sp.]